MIRSIINSKYKTYISPVLSPMHLYSTISLYQVHTGINIHYYSNFQFKSIRSYCTESDTPKLLTKEEVSQRIIQVIQNFEKVNAAIVQPTSHFINDLGLDSLDVVEVVMAVETEFSLDIPDHDAEKIMSVNEAIDYIVSHPMSK